jgi:hypothetical protein
LFCLSSSSALSQASQPYAHGFHVHRRPPAIKLARHEASIFGMVVQPDAPAVNILNVVQIDPATAQRMAELYVARHTGAK